MDQPYRNSLPLKALRQKSKSKQPLPIAFLDIDLTLTKSNNDLDQLIKDVRLFLTQKGYIFAVATSRTEELMMSPKEYRLSKEKYGFSRPPPKVFSPNNHGVLDADIIISSSGTKIFLHQVGGGYCEDESYQKKYLLPSPVWRSLILNLIKKINREKELAQIALHEEEKNYQQGKTSIYPPDYRIQLFFKNLIDKLEFCQKFTRLKTKATIIDDSDPIRDEYTIYITPPGGNKKDAVDWLLGKICHQLLIGEKLFKILFAGDSWPDLKMGLYAADDVDRVVFIIVGGSRLTPYLTEKKYQEFAGNDLSQIKKFLLPEGRQGFYRFVNLPHPRTVVIGDQAFPGKLGPATLLAYLS